MHELPHLRRLVESWFAEAGYTPSAAAVASGAHPAPSPNAPNPITQFQRFAPEAFNAISKIENYFATYGEANALKATQGEKAALDQLSGQAEQLYMSRFWQKTGNLPPQAAKIVENYLLACVGYLDKMQAALAGNTKHLADREETFEKRVQPYYNALQRFFAAHR